MGALPFFGLVSWSRQLTFPCTGTGPHSDARMLRSVLEYVVFTLHLLILGCPARCFISVLGCWAAAWPRDCGIPIRSHSLSALVPVPDKES